MHYEGFHVAPLAEAVERDRLVGVLLVRLGRYAVGVVNSAGLVASKTDTRYVKSPAPGWRVVAAEVRAQPGAAGAGVVRQGVRGRWRGAGAVRGEA